MSVSSFLYESGLCPDGYTCQCGKSGVRLYREYQTFLNHITLLCRSCSLIEQNKEQPDQQLESSIGWRVAAVPTEDGETFWGYSSIPDNGCRWWYRLPADHPEKVAT